MRGGQSGAGESGAGGSPASGGSVLPLRTRGGQVLLTCSASGIADLRAVTEIGWSARWMVTDDGQVAVSFRRGFEVHVVVLGCSGGTAWARDGSRVVTASPGAGIARGSVVIMPSGSRSGSHHRWRR